MIDEVGPKSIVVGGKVDENEKYVEPTVLKGKKHCCCLMFLLVRLVQSCCPIQCTNVLYINACAKQHLCH